MIELNTQHPDFDLGMELLCSLTTKTTPTGLLADDLGVSDQRSRSRLSRIQPGQSITGLVAKLNERFEIITSGKVGSRTAQLGFDHVNARIAAQNYWTTIYGDHSHA